MSLEKVQVSTPEQREKPEFGAVVALGKNWRLPIEGKRIYLSIESKMTALAAGELYKNGIASKIIISTGKTAGKDSQGNDWPSEADEMKRFLRIFFPKDEIPESAIELETHSFDTAGNAEETKRILERERIKDVALLTVGFHLPRSMKLFKNYGINIKQGLESEQILAQQRSPRYQSFMEEYHQSDRYQDLVKLEGKAKLLVDTIDSKGKITRLITKVTRHR